MVNLPQAMAARIEEMLDLAAATNVTTDGPNVRFTTRFFRGVWNWNILGPFDRGEILVEKELSFLTIRYRLSTGRMLLIATAMVGLLGLITWKDPISLRQNAPF